MNKIDILNITDEKIFKDSEVHFSYANIIYGKNGTGKSTLAKKIKSEYQDQYDIRVFNGFESILNSDKTLNTITLGQKNNQIESEIKEIEIKIQKLKNIKDNLGLENCESDIDTLKKHLSTSLTDKARKIKNKYNIVSYNKTRLKRDLDNLQGKKFDIGKLEKILKQQALPKLENKFIKVNELYCNLKRCVESANNIITRDITKESIHTFKSIEERNWIEQGIKLHKDSNGNISSNCIFCNNVLSDERIDQLLSYLDDSQKKIK